MTLPKLPEPDCRAYAPQLGAHGNYWLEASVRAIQEEAYRAGMAAAVPDGLLNKLVDVLDDAKDLGPWTSGWASVELIQLREHFTAMLAAVKEVK